jgi:glycosyltransferase involved in cell wall biosynthesis
VCEALQVGLPVVGLATTEMSRAIENGVSGYVDTDVDALVSHMERLLEHPDEAHALSEGARRAGRERYGIERFAERWTRVIDEAAVSRTSRRRKSGVA